MLKKFGVILPPHFPALRAGLFFVRKVRMEGAHHAKLVGALPFFLPLPASGRFRFPSLLFFQRFEYTLSIISFGLLYIISLQKYNLDSRNPQGIFRAPTAVLPKGLAGRPQEQAKYPVTCCKDTACAYISVSITWMDYLFMGWN